MTDLNADPSPTPTEPGETAMTVAQLRTFLAPLPADLEVLVTADDVTGQNVFAALKAAAVEHSHDDDHAFVRLYADDTDDPVCLCDGASYFTAAANATRTPFLVHQDCPFHAPAAPGEARTP